MYDVLIYTVDEGSLREIRQLFPDDFCTLAIAGTIEESLEACQQELFDLAILWGADYEETIGFLTALTVNKFGYIPVVSVMPSADDLANMLALPLVDFMTMPVSKTELFRMVTQVLQDTDVQATIVEGLNWQGSVEEYGLIDLIQMIERSRRNAELILSYGPHSGQVLFLEGQVVAAEFMELRGFPALLKLAFWPRGSFQTRMLNPEQVERNIKDENREILFALVEKLLKLEQIYEGLPDIATPLIRNPLVNPEKMSPLEHRIAQLCAAPQTTVDLLLQLPDENEDVLIKLARMMEAQIIGERSYVEQAVREEKERSSLNRIFDTVSSIFRKKDPGELLRDPYYDEEETEHIHLEIRPVVLTRDESARLSTKMQERYKK